MQVRLVVFHFSYSPFSYSFVLFPAPEPHVLFGCWGTPPCINTSSRARLTHSTTANLGSYFSIRDFARIRYNLFFIFLCVFGSTFAVICNFTILAVNIFLYFCVYEDFTIQIPFPNAVLHVFFFTFFHCAIFHVFLFLYNFEHHRFWRRMYWMYSVNM